MSDLIKIRRALVSVYDKAGLVELAKKLSEFEVEILSTGGTLAAMKKAEIQAVSVSTFTGAPEILGGRVKTLHPKIHAGILYRRGNEEDEAAMTHQEYKPIDLVIVNLYPFEQTVARENATDADIIENIDIGGPSMIRAASKNFDGVVVVTCPDDYKMLMNELDANNGSVGLKFRRKMAARAFALTNHYDGAIADYFANGKPEIKTADEDDDGLPKTLSFNFTKTLPMRYGENPHQKAAFYVDKTYAGPTLAKGDILAGKALSYNNIGDLDAALEMVLDFEEPFACVLKHANPCGAATGETITEAYKKAYESDPLSAFGSIIGLNRHVDMETAQLLHKTHFVECIVAPSFDDEALTMMKKKKARRLMALPEIANGKLSGENIFKFIHGGLLYQSADELITNANSLTCVTDRKPTEEEIEALLFAWKVVKHTKSNAIVITNGTATVGIGMGQTSRVDASELAVKRAGDRAKGGVLASDAFFPMADGLEVALNAGITAAIQPGGSKGDPAVIEAANKAGIAMVFTGARHFRH